MYEKLKTKEKVLIEFQKDKEACEKAIKDSKDSYSEKIVALSKRIEEEGSNSSLQTDLVILEQERENDATIKGNETKLRALEEHRNNRLRELEEENN